MVQVILIQTSSCDIIVHGKTVVKHCQFSDNNHQFWSCSTCQSIKETEMEYILISNNPNIERHLHAVIDKLDIFDVDTNATNVFNQLPKDLNRNVIIHTGYKD